MLLCKLLLISTTFQHALSQYDVQRLGNTNCYVPNLMIQNYEITNQRNVDGQGCLELCLKYPNCKAVMVNINNQYGTSTCHVFGPGYTTYTRNTHGFNRYQSAERTCFDKAVTLSQDPGNMFQLVDSSGNYITGQQSGLLLYRGGTVCSINFNMTAAHAVCRFMGFKKALSWKSGKIWKNQERHEVVSKGLACSVNDWSSCKFITDVNGCKDHTQDVFLTCSGNRSPFTLVNFSGSQISGYQQFLLLYKGGTVCGDHFDDISADAICRDMGYHRAEKWRMGEAGGTLGTAQIEYHIALDDVSCTHRNWKSCSYTTSHDCTHGKVIYLSCASVPDNSKRSVANTGESSSLSTVLLTLFCLSLMVMVLKKNSQIDDLTKRCAETDTLVKNLQDELKEQQSTSTSKTYQETELEESSGGEYQNVLGPD